MKTRSLSQYRSLYYFREHKTLRTGLSVLIVIALLNLVTGCSYYRVKTVPPQDPRETAQQIKAFNEADKYIILHKNNASLHLANPVVNEDNLELSGTVTMLSEEHEAERIIEPGRSYRYKKKNTFPSNEIHIFLKEGDPLALGNTIISMEDIEKMGVINNDVATSAVYASLGVLGSLVVVMAIYAALKSSCPFIYVYNGEEYVFSGELYPGNILKNAQQTDYLPLPSLKEADGVYKIQITNELLEIQHTDLAELLVVKHPRNTIALTDKNGEVLLFGSLNNAVETVLDGSLRNKQPGMEKDGHSYMFNTPFSSTDSKRNAVFTFNKPADVQNAKLFIRAKNSLWLDYVFGKFNKKFGSYYNAFQKQQQKTSAEDAFSWVREQNIPLTVSIKKDGSWKEVESLPSVGPLSYRDLGIQLDLEGIDEEVVEIKLETGYMFWEVDYVGIDYSVDLPYEKVSLKPNLAITHTGQDVTDLLTLQDGLYLTQEHIGDKVEVSYNIGSLREDLEQSLFLKNRGYYTYIRDYKGIPDFAELKKFRDPNTFTRFSENEYHRILKAFESKKEGYVVR